MLVVTGIFDNERFIPDKPVFIPQKTKVIVTINTEIEVNDIKKPLKNFSKAEKDAITKTLFGVLPSDIDLDEAREERLT